MADTEAAKQAYQTGRLTNAGGGLRDIPIIDYRAYADDSATGDIHLRYHSFSMRERLRKANGDADNQVMVVEDFRYGYYSSDSPMLLGALAQMDKWLATHRRREQWRNAYRRRPRRPSGSACCSSRQACCVGRFRRAACRRVVLHRP